MYDEKCYELAVVFLADNEGLDTEDNRQELATEIQEVIEGFFEKKRTDGPQT